MSLFSQRWQLEHFLPRDPKIDEDANHEPVHGDVLAFDSGVGKFVSATPPVAQNLGGTAVNGDLLEWDDATDTFVLQGPVFGTIYVSSGAATQAVTSTAAKLDGFAANGESLNTTVDHTDDSITVLESGIYLVTFTASYSHAAAVSGVFFSLRVDGVGDLQTDGLQAGSVAISGHVNLAEDAVVTVYVSNAAAEDGNLTLTNAQLSVTRVGPYVAP